MADKGEPLMCEHFGLKQKKKRERTKARAKDGGGHLAYLVVLIEDTAIPYGQNQLLKKGRVRVM